MSPTRGVSKLKFSKEKVEKSKKMADKGFNEEMASFMMTMMNRMLQEQSAMNRMESELTLAVQTVIERISKFNGEDVTRFLEVYEYEMASRGATGVQMVSHINRVCTLDVRARVTELSERFHEDWVGFRQALLDEYMLDDQTRMTKKSFLEWTEKGGKGLSVSELLREFEKRYNELSVKDRELLQSEKVDLFVRAADKSFRKDITILLEDRTSTTGLVSNWAEVPEACRVLRRRALRMEDGYDNRIKTIARENPKQDSGTRTDVGKGKEPESAINELIKGMRDLQLKFTKLEKGESSSVRQKLNEGEKGEFIRRCIWCDSTEHQKRDCQSHKEALERNVIFYQNGRIHSSETRQPLKTNFGKGGMKKVMEDEESKNVQAMYFSTTSGLKVDDPQIGSGFWGKVIKSATDKRVQPCDLRKAGDEVRSSTGWNDPVDSLTAIAKIAGVNAHEVTVEEKRRRTEEAGPSRKPETREQKRRETERAAAEATKEDKGKQKVTPSFKLASDIETSTDLKHVLESRILDSKVELTLREVLGIAKKEFHEVIIDVIRRKRQVVEETGGVNTVMIREEDEDMETALLAGVRSADTQCSHEEERSHYTRTHWARATTEAPVRIGDQMEPCVALIDHGSEINIISSDFYNRGRWPIERNHGWKVRAATEVVEDLCGACPNIKVTIGDVSVDQNFFVQEKSFYPVILGQPYITAVRMETKVIDNGAAFARIRSQDGKRSVQFLTVRPNHERNKENLRDHPLRDVGDFVQDF